MKQEMQKKETQNEGKITFLSEKIYHLETLIE